MYVCLMLCMYVSLYVWMDARMHMMGMVVDMNVFA